MTKFEEELNKKMDLKEVPMYFTQSGCSMTRKTYIETNWIFDNYKNWHSDEEFQELLEQNAELTRENNIVNQINSKLESQIIDLKSQLQQQALPVVPECVGEFITKIKKAHNSLRFAFNSKFNECPAEYWNEAIVWRLNNPDEFARAWLDGYTVEKPQLFKLIFPNSTAVLQKDGELNSFADTVYKRYLIENAMTEQEIKSIDERYLQFAVPVEDGE